MDQVFEFIGRWIWPVVLLRIWRFCHARRQHRFACVYQHPERSSPWERPGTRIADGDDPTYRKWQPLGIAGLSIKCIPAPRL